jgi:C1A family cysteine protease
MNPFRVRASRYDSRDRVYKSQNLEVPDVVDLREYDTAIEDQGELGSCVGASVVSAYELMTNISRPDQFQDLSKLYAYYHARLLEGSENYDEGVYYIRNAIKGIHKFGICQENLWAYDAAKVSTQPELECYVDAWPRKIESYNSVYSLGDMMEALYLKRPIVTGLTVFDNFSDLISTNSVVTAPKGSSNYFGGHAVTLVGYSRPSKWFIAKNSYGESWGDRGYCYIPFDYIIQYGFDKWVFDLKAIPTPSL